MVSCKLYGRLGNQMFQIAAAIGYAKKWGLDYTIPTESVNKEKWPAYFDHFPVKPFNSIITYKENGHEYQDIPKHDNILLDGYFQSELYFRHCREEIIDAFRIPYYWAGPVVSIHVRRGDYLTLSRHHPVLPFDYYERAICFFKKEGFGLFKVFSDDMDWCRENINADNFRGCRFMYIEYNSALSDISEMSGCEHNIIANSSFSWWGAWLNQNPNKMVISPSCYSWFGPALSHLSPATILPKEWLQVNKPQIVQ